jgi:hypothetical protein
MSAENIGTKKTLEVLNLGGTMTSEHIDANEQLICWACSQAIVQASSGNPVAATMILEGLVYSLRRGADTAGRSSPEWRELFSEGYQEAKDHIASSMEMVFYGAGGTSCSFQDLVRFD